MVGGQTDGCQKDGQTDGQKDAWMINGWTDGQMDDGLMDRWTDRDDRCMDGLMDGWIVSQTDEWVDRQK